MQEMKLNREILRLVLPLMAEQFLLIAVGSIDTLMVSGIGESAVAAVSAMDSINALFINMFTAIGAGGAVVMAQYLGRDEDDKAASIARQLLILVFCLSGALMLLTVGLHRPLVQALDRSADAETMGRSYTYLSITALSFPFLGIYNGCVAILRATGDTKSSMKMSLICNGLNILGNALLIFALKMDVAGAALATLIARAAVSVLSLRTLFWGNRRVRLPRVDRQFFRLEKKRTVDILRQGIPAGVENSLFQLGKILVMSIVSTLPTAQRAANGVCNIIVGLANAPGVALGMGAVALISPVVGAGKKDEAMHLGKRLLLLMYALELPINLLMAALAKPVLSLYALSDAGREAGALVLVVYALVSIALWSPALGLPFILRSAGDAKYTMLVSMTTMLLLRVGVCYLYVFVFKLELMGVWLAMFTDWAARSLLFGYRFFKGKWLDQSAISD